MIVSKIGFLKLSYAAVVNAILVSPGRIFLTKKSVMVVFFARTVVRAGSIPEPMSGP